MQQRLKRHRWRWLSACYWQQMTGKAKYTLHCHGFYAVFNKFIHFSAVSRYLKNRQFRLVDSAVPKIYFQYFCWRVEKQRVATWPPRLRLIAWKWPSVWQQGPHVHIFHHHLRYSQYWCNHFLSRIEVLGCLLGTGRTSHFLSLIKQYEELTPTSDVEGQCYFYVKSWTLDVKLNQFYKEKNIINGWIVCWGPVFFIQLK